MKYENKFKAAEFLSDIGLGFAVQQLLKSQPLIQESNSVIKMKCYNPVAPSIIIQRHLNNQINTYGKETVKKVIENFIKNLK